MCRKLNCDFVNQRYTISYRLTRERLTEKKTKNKNKTWLSLKPTQYCGRDNLFWFEVNNVNPTRRNTIYSHQLCIFCFHFYVWTIVRYILVNYEDIKLHDIFIYFYFISFLLLLFTFGHCLVLKIWDVHTFYCATLHSKSTYYSKVACAHQ